MINLTDLDEHGPQFSRISGSICTNGRTSDRFEVVDKDGSVVKFPYRFQLDSSVDARVQNQWRITQENGM